MINRTPLKNCTFLGAAVMAALLTSCSMPSIKQPVSTEVFYMRDMDVSVNGSAFLPGVITAPKSGGYTITLKSPGDMSFVSVRSCSREIPKEKVPGRTYTYVYIPQDPLETEDCPVEVASFDISGGQNAWAFIDFDDPNGVDGRVLCNGGIVSGKTSVCQAHVGLRQAIEFQEEMLAPQKSVDCDYQLSALKGKYFEFIMPGRACNLEFMSIESGKVHRMTTLGYEDKFLRKNL